MKLLFWFWDKPYPGFLILVFIVCSTNVGKLVMSYLEVGWMCGGVAHSWLHSTGM